MTRTFFDLDNDVSAELFGSDTVDGFSILAELDTNGDLVIDAQDAAWGELLVWQDANGDAVSQAGELYTLDHFNITSIDLAGVSPSTDVIAGNPISHTSTFTMNGTQHTIVDAWFVHDDTNSIYTGDYTLDVRTLFLPEAANDDGRLPVCRAA
ncbi:MAG: hypothetical protein EOM26_06255 [Alphaproteobacteria bacterium]|nr:hypothetical protein [Alphaproteobacteria bacterium]